MGAYASLRERLVNRKYEPGQRLRADVLAEGFGCSLSAMREMLFRLSSVGLATFQQQRGFRVPPASARLQHELTHMRIMLEGEGAGSSMRLGGRAWAGGPGRAGLGGRAWEAKLAAAHQTPHLIESRICDGQSDSQILVLWTAAALEFHQALIDACGSELLKQTHYSVCQQFRQQRVTRDSSFTFLPENVEQHAGILEAALAHNEDLVCARIAGHLSRNLSEPLPEPIEPQSAAT